MPIVASEPPIVLGDRADSHALAVIEALERNGTRPAVFDSASLPLGGWRWADGELEVDNNGRWVTPRRGWVRRVAPPDWNRGLALGSAEAAEASARLALLTALSSTQIQWLTPYWIIASAENKLVQHRTARALGLPTPRTVVCASIADLPSDFPDRFIVKPLGVGEFMAGDTPHALHAQVLDREDHRLSLLNRAPFILQERIDATAHLRIVTVGTRTWSARLPADGLPVDWRASSAAHSGWSQHEDAAVELAATALASAIGTGYSSQDWIVSGTGEHWFIDLNPAGQWLFLPEAIGGAVTSAIAEWLGGLDG